MGKLQLVELSHSGEIMTDQFFETGYSMPKRQPEQVVSVKGALSKSSQLKKIAELRAKHGLGQRGGNG